MSASLPVIDAPTPEALPPRTWRHWWDRSSGLCRIAVWAGGFFLIAHGLLAARIAIGLQEDPLVAEFRSRGSVLYSWETSPELFPGHHLLLAGLRGRSCRNVNDLYLEGTATDADLEQIGSRFKQLEFLDLAGTEITSAGLRSLLNCGRLESLDLTDTDIGDDGVKALVALPRLEHLHMAGTRITDASLPALAAMPELEFFDPEWTDFAPSAREALLRTPGARATVNSGQDDFPRLVRAAIRWSDGEICERFPDDPSFREKNPYRQANTDTEGIGEKIVWFTKFFGCYVNRYTFGRSMLNGQVTDIARTAIARGDGEYAVGISFGDCHSEMIAYSVTDGRLSTDRFEFRMPLTRAQARRLAESAK